jgi:HAD superfamily hydrolase (TIGR01509 family)
MQSFELVIFDNDGVLVDSEPHAMTVLTRLLGEYGLPLSPEECFSLFTGSSMGRVRRISEARLGRQLPPDFEDRYHDDLFARLRYSLKPIPGIESALTAIDLPKCVASSGTHERVRLTLEVTGLWSLFDGRAFSSEDVARGKPSPDLFLHAASKLGVSPERCAVIEDSPLGIEAANRAGMTSFGYAGATPEERLRNASGAVFTKMEELPALLGC